MILCEIKRIVLQCVFIQCGYHIMWCVNMCCFFCAKKLTHPRPLFTQLSPAQILASTSIFLGPRAFLMSVVFYWDLTGCIFGCFDPCQTSFVLFENNKKDLSKHVPRNITVRIWCFCLFLEFGIGYCFFACFILVLFKTRWRIVLVLLVFFERIVYRFVTETLKRKFHSVRTLMKSMRQKRRNK